MDKDHITFKDRRKSVEFGKDFHAAGGLTRNPLGKPISPQKRDEHIRGNPIIYNHKLALFDESLKEEDLSQAFWYFSDLKYRLDTDNKMPKEQLEKFKESLAKRGYRLLKREGKQGTNYLTEEGLLTSEEILEYSQEHLGNKSSGLEKAATVISLLMIIAGLAFWYPGLTGNVVAENSKTFVGGGLALFVLGLAGVFIANKK